MFLRREIMTLRSVMSKREITIISVILVVGLILAILSYLPMGWEYSMISDPDSYIAPQQGVRVIDVKFNIFGQSFDSSYEAIEWFTYAITLSNYLGLGLVLLGLALAIRRIGRMKGEPWYGWGLLLGGSIVFFLAGVIVAGLTYKESTSLYNIDILFYAGITLGALGVLLSIKMIDYRWKHWDLIVGAFILVGVVMLTIGTSLIIGATNSIELSYDGLHLTENLVLMGPVFVVLGVGIATWGSQYLKGEKVLRTAFTIVLVLMIMGALYLGTWTGAVPYSTILMESPLALWLGFAYHLSILMATGIIAIILVKGMRAKGPAKTDGRTPVSWA
jgi:hypothetical protein